MFGCIGRLGCLVVLLIAGAVGWFTRDAWYPKLRGRLGAPQVVAATAAVKWEPLTPEGGARARLAIGRLSAKNGPVYVDIAAGDLAAYALDDALRGMNRDTVSAEALARDDHLFVRAHVDLASFVDVKSLGPLASIIGGTQEITVRGRLEVGSPGHAQFVVDQIAIKELQLPEPIIETIVGRILPKLRDASTAKNAIPVPAPRDLADVRIAHGHVVLYKAVP